MSEESDAELIRRWREEGDEPALFLLLGRHARGARAFVRVELPDDLDADGIVWDALARAVQRFDPAKADDLRPLLEKILRDLIVSYRRAQGIRAGHEAAAATAEEDGIKKDVLCKIRLRLDLDECLRSLDERTRTILHLTCTLGFNDRELATFLGESTRDAARGKATRARKKARELPCMERIHREYRGGEP